MPNSHRRDPGPATPPPQKSALPRRGAVRRNALSRVLARAGWHAARRRAPGTGHRTPDTGHRRNYAHVPGRHPGCRRGLSPQRWFSSTTAARFRPPAPGGDHMADALSADRRARRRTARARASPPDATGLAPARPRPPRRSSTRARRHVSPSWRHWRHHPRVTSHGLTATIAQAPDAAATVLDISEGGLRVDGLTLAPGTAVEFALEGEQLHGTGTGVVVHRSDETTGIAVHRWHGTLASAVRDVTEKALLATSTWWELYLDPPARSRPAAVIAPTATPTRTRSSSRRWAAHRSGLRRLASG